MKRALAALLLFAVACAAQPPERSPLPDIASVLPEPQGCLLTVGEATGVSVEAVVAGSAAEGDLEPGDVLVAIDGRPVSDVDELVTVMSGYSPGDTVSIRYRRNGTETRLDLRLGANPNDPNRPFIGVNIRSALEQVGVDEVTGEVTPGPTSRLIQIGDEVLLFDPLTPVWEPTGIELEPDAVWVSTRSGIYVAEGNDPIGIVELRTGDRVPVDDFEGWSPRRILGSVGESLVLMVTMAVPDEPGVANVGVALFDPEGGQTLWVRPVLDGFGLPVAAHGSPDGTVVVVVGADQETSTTSGVDVYDLSGTLRNAPDLTTLGVPVGWFDERSMAFRSSNDTISVFDFVEGATVAFSVPPALVAAPVATVGDGRHVLTFDGRSLRLDDLTRESEIRLLADNCTLGPVGALGFGL